MVDLPASAVLNSGPVHQAVLNALDQLGLAVLVKDLSSGRYVYASDAASRLLHAGDDALEGVQDADIFDATQAVALRAADVQAASMPNGLRSEHRMELRGARRDFRVWRQQVALEGQSEPHLLSRWQDITAPHVIHPPAGAEMLTHLKYAIVDQLHVAQITLLGFFQATRQPAMGHSVFQATQPACKFGKLFDCVHG